jgi:hypothetical protein
MTGMLAGMPVVVVVAAAPSLGLRIDLAAESINTPGKLHAEDM